MSKLDCNNYVNRELKRDYEWLKEVDKFALTNAVFAMDNAYQRFFNLRSGYPKFKSKHYNRHSYTTNMSGANIKVLFDQNKIQLPKLKHIKAHLSRPFYGQIKNATISQTPSGKYFVSITVETEHVPSPSTGSMIGIDLGIKDLAIVAYGEEKIVFHNINKSKRMRSLNKRLKHLQRTISRKYEANRSGSRYNKTKNIASTIRFDV